MLHCIASVFIFFSPVLVSFPPMIGHTTLVTLCGFAYGMKGFYIASTASVFGSALSFTILRLLFSKRLREWSGKSDKWQALESVVVRSCFNPSTTSLTHCLAESEGPSVNYSRSSVPSSTLGLFKLPLCCKRSHQYSHSRIYRLHTLYSRLRPCLYGNSS